MKIIASTIGTSPAFSRSWNILIQGNLYFRGFKSQLIVIIKYACICSEVKQIKFIKVACTQMKQANRRMFFMTDIKANRNKMVSKKTALL